MAAKKQVSEKGSLGKHLAYHEGFSKFFCNNDFLKSDSQCDLERYRYGVKLVTSLFIEL